MNKNIKFQVLKTRTEEAYQDYIINFLINTYQQEKKIVVIAPEQFCNVLDKALWLDGKPQFIPHGFYDKEKEILNLPIIFAKVEDIAIFADKKIDLILWLEHVEIDQLCNATEIVQIVDQNPQRLQDLRSHYKSYKQKGYQLAVENIEGS